MAVNSQNNGMMRKEYGIYWKYLLCAVVTTVSLAMLAVLFFKMNMDVKFLSQAACQQVKVTPFSKEYTFCFYGSDWDEGTYLSSITNFYSSLVTVLIAVQGLVSALAFIVIKASNKRIIEEEVESELPKYFGTVAAVDQMKSFVGGVVRSSIVDETKELNNRILGLESEIEELQANMYELVGSEDIENENLSSDTTDKG